MGDSRAMYYSSIGYWLLLLRLPPREPGFKILKLSSKKVSIRFVLFWFCFFVGGAEWREGGGGLASSFSIINMLLQMLTNFDLH